MWLADAPTADVLRSARALFSSPPMAAMVAVVAPQEPSLAQHRPPHQANRPSVNRTGKTSLGHHNTDSRTNKAPASAIVGDCDVGPDNGST